MTIKNRPAVRAAASESLAANPGEPRLVVLIYTAIIAASTLLVSVLLTVLDNRIAETGGIGGMGLRSILSTIRTVLPLAQTLALMGLEMGYRKSTLHMARRHAAVPRNLTEGFRWFAPLLRSVLLQGGLYFLLAMGAVYAASFIFMLTPLAESFYNLVVPYLTDPDAFYNALYTDDTLFWQVAESLAPVLPIFLVLFLVAAAPFFYQYRMTNYCILEAPHRSAMAAMRESAMMMKGHRLDLLKLDLGFWWFALGQLAVTAVLYGDHLLPLVGVTLPWSATVSYYVFYVASLLLEGVLYYFFLNRVETTYATVYDILRPKPQPSQGGVVLGNIFDLARDYHEDDRA